MPRFRRGIHGNPLMRPSKNSWMTRINRAMTMLVEDKSGYPLSKHHSANHGFRIMALKVELKPGERIILGDSVITNDTQRTRLFIEGSAPILREKDIMRVDEADSPCKKIYLMVQMMYLAADPTKHNDIYFELVKDVCEAAPSTRPYVDAVNNRILTGEMYKALKEARKLVDYEQELIGHAKSG